MRLIVKQTDFVGHRGEIAEYPGRGRCAETRDAAEQRRRPIEQKFRLFESIVKSMSARVAAAATVLAQQAHRALDEAKEAIAADRLDQAGRTLDAGLKEAAKAAARTAIDDASAKESVARSSIRISARGGVCVPRPTGWRVRGTTRRP